MLTVDMHIWDHLFCMEIRKVMTFKSGIMENRISLCLNLNLFVVKLDDAIVCISRADES